MHFILINEINLTKFFSQNIKHDTLVNFY